jgi:hypothetical protein
MIVAIALAGTGIARIEEFRQGASVAAAIDSFVNVYTPPKNAGDYVGLDVGATKPDPPTGKIWKLDRDTMQLVDRPIPTPKGPRRLYMRSPDGTKWILKITNAGSLTIEEATE